MLAQASVRIVPSRYLAGPKFSSSQSNVAIAVSNYEIPSKVTAPVASFVIAIIYHPLPKIYGSFHLVVRLFTRNRMVRTSPSLMKSKAEYRFR